MDVKELMENLKDVEEKVVRDYALVKLARLHALEVEIDFFLAAEKACKKAIKFHEKSLITMDEAIKIIASA